MTGSESDADVPPRQDPTTQHLSHVGQPSAEAGPDESAPLSQGDRATIDALRPGTALLIVLRGPNTGARFLLDDTDVTSGRSPESDIFLDDVTVSRKHAVFHREVDQFSVRDVGSLNGTYVNRDRIDEVVLQTGDEVQIGKFRLVFYAGKS